jgi:hypothetical protein
MRAAVRTLVLALTALIAAGPGVARAQLWKPAKKTTTTTEPAKPTRAKPTKPKRTRRAARPARPAARPAVVRDDPPRRERARPSRADDLPEFDDDPEIVVELPTRGER